MAVDRLMIRVNWASSGRHLATVLVFSLPIVNLRLLCGPNLGESRHNLSLSTTTAMRQLTSSLLFSSLPFLIEGVNGLNPTPLLKKRQFQTPTTDASSPTSAPVFLLRNIQSSLTTCTPVNITWAYAGPATPSLNLFATNIGVVPPTSETSPTNTFTDGDAFAVPSGASQSQPTQVTIVQNLVPQASAVAWNVNVPSGWYQIFGNFQSTFQDQTDPFFVQAGDTSCLSGGTSSPSATPSSPASESPISTLVPGPGGTNPPVATTQKNSQIGIIVGVVAGAVVFLIIVLMAYLWLRKRKNALDKPIGGHSGGANLNRGWGGLGSLSSVHSGRHDRRSRASRDLTPATRIAGHRPATRNPFGAGFAENGENRSINSTPFSPSVEKFSSSPAPYTNPFDDAEGGLALATLPSNDGMPVSPSRTSLQQAGLSLPQIQSSSADSFAYFNEPRSTHGRASSIDVHLHSSLSSSPPPEMIRSYSASSSARAPSTDYSHQQQKKANRQSTGSQSNIPRKTARKPVPAYEPSVSASTTLSPDSSSPSASYAPSPSTPTSTSMPFGPSAYGHYAKRPQPSSDGNSLAHKSSFGPGGVEGKPIHYLIPDMPLPNNG
ncbi:hypothetical protein D9756_008319 [Leucocoprinus leucothites]|uniref:Uncharacterized protein n=1 Tax=Leucocoprinus leucothites TaxID=201217 RepID=A0A8H5D2P4_9AGAR|nr:hypothetical protein D9756_008319 [Leucoagaricus leucothites]